MFFASSTCPKKAILLVQFGTPSSPKNEDIHAFLSEVLQEHLFSFLPRSIIHNCISPWILPSVCSRYHDMWDEKKDVSPLLSHSIRFAQKLQLLLPEDTALSLGMLHGFPNIDDSLSRLRTLSLEKLVIFPLFPFQTPITKAIYKKCFTFFPHASFPISRIDSFHHTSFFLESLVKKLSTYDLQNYDHLLFSFHALPFSYFSYKKACFETARAIAVENYSVAFQSKIGLDWMWTGPSMKDVLRKLFFQGKRRILVIAPSFVVDCSETLGEIAIGYKKYFIKLGGTDLTLVESLNDFDPWVESAAIFLRSYL